MRPFVAPQLLRADALERPPTALPPDLRSIVSQLTGHGEVSGSLHLRVPRGGESFAPTTHLSTEMMTFISGHWSARSNRAGMCEELAKTT